MFKGNFLIINVKSHFDKSCSKYVPVKQDGNDTNCTEKPMISILTILVVVAVTLTGSWNPYLSNVKIILTMCKISQQLFIVGLKRLEVNYKGFDCDLTQDVFIHGFNKYVGHVAQAARHLATGCTARFRSPVSEEWRFSSLLRVQTGPGVHSAFYKWVPETFPG